MTRRKTRPPKGCSFVEGYVRCYVQIDRQFQYNAQGMKELDAVVQWLINVRCDAAEEYQRRAEERKAKR